MTENLEVTPSQPEKNRGQRLYVNHRIADETNDQKKMTIFIIFVNAISISIHDRLKEK